MLENMLGDDGVEIPVAGAITTRSACILEGHRFEERDVFTTGTWTRNGFEKMKQKYQKSNCKYENHVQTHCRCDPRYTMCQQCHVTNVLMV